MTRDVTSHFGPSRCLTPSLFCRTQHNVHDLSGQPLLRGVTFPHLIDGCWCVRGEYCGGTIHVAFLCIDGVVDRCCVQSPSQSHTIGIRPSGARAVPHAVLGIAVADLYSVSRQQRHPRGSEVTNRLLCPCFVFWTCAFRDIVSTHTVANVLTSFSRSPRPHAGFGTVQHLHLIRQVQVTSAHAPILRTIYFGLCV